MVDHEARRRLLDQTLEAARLLDRLDDRARADRPRGPRAGDLWSFPGEAAVEWAVLASEGGRLLVVPADSLPLAGSADLEVPSQEPCGPLTLRCRLGLHVEPHQLAAGRRSGTLSESAVQRARFQYRRWRADHVEAGEANDTDDDAGYQQHCEELAAIRDRRFLTHGEIGPRSAVANLPAKAALGLMFVLLLVLASGLIWQRRELQELEARGVLQPAEQGIAGEGDPEVNVPFLWLRPEEVLRGEAEAWQIPDTAELVLLILQIDDLRPVERYVVELFSEGEELPLWASQEAIRTGTTELSIAFPRHHLPAGSYRVRLAATIDGQPTHLHDYSFRVVAGVTQRQSP